MSEYWVSKKRYFCKYCDIYIADDAPSRQQHENGLRHKGNVERFIRGIYKAGEKKKKDEEEERREMARVEQAAQAAFAEDVGAGRAKLSSAPPVASTSAAAKKPVQKPSNPFANYSTAESLGYNDPDAERLAAEAELKRSQGVAGEWQIVSPPPGQPVSVTPKLEEDGSVKVEEGEGAEAGMKREAEAPPEDDPRSFKLRKKTVAPGLGKIYDPGVIPIKLKKEEPSQAPLPSLLAPVAPAKTSSASAGSNATDVPKWTTISLKPSAKSEILPTGSTSQLETKPDPDAAESSTSTSRNLSSNGTSDEPAKKWTKIQWSTSQKSVKDEPTSSIYGVPTPAMEEEDVKPDPATLESKDAAPAVKAEDEASPTPPPVGGSMFRKRKTPTGAGRGRR
ncbi:hypothetical protein BDQ12DRAFT_640729 [Crucibulum laeve]|uniref:Matrin-type domain-containing protein n=1 Tax=Crucibulum laeve TaxID=68775 RepID=A0A5C3MIS2_9AGAR|nr:hypothetical protein BDQ12DRAFT_640729 [Crucibulum laeve]